MSNVDVRSSAVQSVDDSGKAQWLRSRARGLLAATGPGVALIALAGTPAALGF
jgi:hypothetical protein